MNSKKNMNNDAMKSSLINDLTKLSKIDKFDNLLPEIEHVKDKAAKIVSLTANKLYLMT